jgi:hypothetical protein
VQYSHRQDDLLRIPAHPGASLAPPGTWSRQFEATREVLVFILL